MRCKFEGNLKTLNVIKSSYSSQEGGRRRTPAEACELDEARINRRIDGFNRLKSIQTSGKFSTKGAFNPGSAAHEISKND
jgi:hypothetical protein